MLRKIVGMLIAALIAGSAIGWAAQYPLTVADLAVDGNDEIRSRDILKAIPFEIGDAIEEAELRTASQAIFDLGWFKEVALDRDALESGNVVFQVVENPVIRSIVIEGNVNHRDYSLFGIKLFDAPIMSSYKIRQILWRNDVRKRSVLNQDDLTDGLKEVISEYQSRGYVYINISEVDASETLTITFMEHAYSGSLIEGLETVPESVVQELVEMPLGRPLRGEDLQRANTALINSVYFTDFELEPQVGLDPLDVWIRWTLTERNLWNEPASIDRVSIEGNSIYDDELLGRLIGVLPAQIEDNYDMLAFVKGIHDRYVRGGYSMVELSVEAIEDGELRLRVAEGVISQVILAGNTKTHDYVIERNSEVEVGEVFNRLDLVASYQKLMSLGYFSSLDFVREWGEEGVEVTITVTEKTDLGGFGGSMAIDPSTGELFGELTLNEKNIFGTGQDLELSYNHGLAGTDNTNPSTWNLGYSTVAYFPGFSRVGLDFYQKSAESTEDEVSSVTTTLGGEVSFSYPIAAYSNAGISFRHEEERVSGEAFWTPADVINLTLVYNDTNDPFFPTTGNRHRLSLEKAGGFSAGLEYTKFDFTWTHFVPTSMSLVSVDIDQAGLGRCRGSSVASNRTWRIYIDPRTRR
jgi:outer membrane protein insertion porin family